ncbi:Retrovirus-related Pol polyprotein from transposon opus, partial [Mucuna pruriens]
MLPHQEDPVVISTVAAEYKIDQGSFANVLYWSTFQKMEVLESRLEECASTLIGFSGEQVEIRGCIKIKTTFGMGRDAKTILIKYIVVIVRTSYNVILGQLTLNKLYAIVSIPHLCMKYPVDGRVGTIRGAEDQRSGPAKDLKEIQIGGDPCEKIKIRASLEVEMHSLDEAKTAFTTDSGNFYYKVMSFGVKNVGAIYQRLMDKIFKEHIGCEMEVIVDNMVVNSPKENRHCEALASVFVGLRKHKLKLNPEKFSFDVQAEKFLGFMLIQRRI